MWTVKKKKKKKWRFGAALSVSQLAKITLSVVIGVVCIADSLV